MTRLAEIRSRLDGMSELNDIVGAMRSLAGMRMQEGLGSLPAIRQYAESISGVIANVMRLAGRPATTAPNGSRGKGLILFTSEHGFVGGFNERLINAAREALGPDDVLFVLGTRGYMLMTEQGCRIDWHRALATRSGSAPDVVQALVWGLYGRIAQGGLDQVDAIYTRYRSSGSADVVQRRILPLEESAARPAVQGDAPLHNLAPGELLEELVEEHVFAALTAAAVESIVSENAARLAAMEAARENIGQRLANLNQEARLARQAEITTEILELVTAAKALADEDTGVA